MSSISGTSAMVTDIDRRKALPIIRALGKEGVRVIGLSYNRYPMGQFSKYCTKVYLCPDYRTEPEKFLDRLEQICADEQPDVFYPIEDVVLALCVRHSDRWMSHTTALLPGEADLERASDKWRTIQFARECGIPVPESYCPDDLYKVSQLAGKSLQWVVKPRKGSGSRGIRYIENPEDLLEAYQQVEQDYPHPIVQERIPAGGEGVGVFFLLDRNRDLLAVFGHRRLREYPVTGGPSTLRESYRDDALIERSASLVKKMGCVGVSMVEYKRDLRSNQFVLMEVNPRFWGSLQLAIHAGVNFPILYHMAALGMKVEPVMSYPVGMLCRWLWPGDILHFLANPDRFRMKPGFFQFSHPKLAYDIVSVDDPGPMLGIFIEALRKMWQRER